MKKDILEKIKVLLGMVEAEVVDTNLVDEGVTGVTDDTTGVTDVTIEDTVKELTQKVEDLMKKYDDIMALLEGATESVNTEEIEEMKTQLKLQKEMIEKFQNDPEIVPVKLQKVDTAPITADDKRKAAIKQLQKGL